MEIESLFGVPINLNNFPAKLWSLANDPQNSSVFWNPSGDGVIIDQRQFQAELISPVKEDHKLFKTTNFTSFIRQLNLYGFRKVPDGPLRDRHPNLHHFYNPNFRKGQPGLLVNLKRLTISNKAKILAGEKVTCRAPSLAGRKSEHSTTYERRGSVHTYKYHSTESHQQRGYDRTPIPSHSWTFHYSDVSPFIPVSVIRRYSPDTPHGFPSTTMLLQQEPKYIPHHSSYTPGYFTPVICQCCTAGIMEAERTGSDQTSLSYSHYGYYSQNYSMRHPHNSIQNPDWTPNDRGDVNLDTVFQMADEFQGLANVHIVREGTPVKPQHTAGLSEPSTSSLYTLAAFSESESVSSHSSRPNTVASCSVSGLYSHDTACGVSTAYIKPKSEVYKTEEQRASQSKEEQPASVESPKQVLDWSARDQRLSLERIITRLEIQTCGK